jgi:hypothetical protein
VAAIERCLLDRDLRPRTLKERMEECAGSVIVAFERLYIADGTEKRGSEAERPMRDELRATVWNQMEGAMAYALGLPLLVLAEKGIWAEGVFEPRGWAVQWLGLNPAELQTPQCLGIIDDWKRHVVVFAERREAAVASGKQERRDLTDETLGEIIGELRPGQFRALVIGVISTLAAVAGTAFSLGVKFG